MNIVIVMTREQSNTIVTEVNIAHTRRSTIAQAMVIVMATGTVMIGGTVHATAIGNITTGTVNRIIIVATIDHAIIQVTTIGGIVIIAAITVIIPGAVMATTITLTNG